MSVCIHLYNFLFFQVSFEFTSQELTLVESFWRFHIPEQNISVPFLLVGQAREPDISMDRSHMNFKALLIGKNSKNYVSDSMYQTFHR